VEAEAVRRLLADMLAGAPRASLPQSVPSPEHDLP